MTNLNASVQASARLLTLHAHWWQELTEEQLAEGARIIINHPSYRARMYREAMSFAGLMGRRRLVVQLMDALAVLDWSDERART